MRRDRIELMLDILDSIRMGSHRISDIIYDVRANYNIVRKYLDILEMKGFIESKPEKNPRRHMFFLTKKGITAIRKLNEQDILTLLERPEIKEEERF